MPVMFRAAGAARALSLMLVLTVTGSFNVLPLTAAASLNEEKLSANRVRPRTAPAPASPAGDAEGRGPALEAYGRLPLSFERNEGQADSRVRFTARGEGYKLYLTAGEAVLALGGGREEISAAAVVRLKWKGAARRPGVEGLERLAGRVNYFAGSDPRRWRADVQTFGRVLYPDLYPGVDLLFYGNQRRLEYDFVVAPGADARAIRLEFAGARRLRLDAGGALVVETAAGELRQPKPFVYQDVDGARREVSASYVLRGAREFGFEVGPHDDARPLVIDPVITYSTFLGGAYGESGYGIAVDRAGHAYVTGTTASDDFPLANAFQAGRRGVGDVFVTKLNPGGTAVVYSTYLGGTYADSPSDIAVDDAGHAYVTGGTTSHDFPVTANAYQTNKGGGTSNTDAFVTKLGPSGNALVYSTYLGGANSSEDAGGVAVDRGGNAYVAGTAAAGTAGTSNLPITADAFQTTYGGGAYDAFAAKLNATGSSLVYSTFLGGSAADTCGGLALDRQGNAYVVGETYSADFPTTPGSLRPSKPTETSDAFVTKLNAAGSAVVYSTYLGGSVTDAATGVAVDASGRAHVTGNTSSPDFAVTPDAFQPRIGQLCEGCATNDAFVTRLDVAGGALSYSTFFGGAAGNDTASALALDAAGNFYVAGATDATDLPVLGAFQFEKDYHLDAFVAEFNAAGRLVYSSYLGGLLNDSARDIAADAAGGAYLTGATQSTDFPVTPGAFQTLLNRNGMRNAADAFVTKVSPASVLASDGQISGQVVTDAGEALSGVTVRLKGWSGAAAVTDAAGRYAFGGLQTGARYTVEAARPGYNLAPWSHAFDGLTGSQTADFTATLKIYVITGRLVDDLGRPLAGVSMTLSGAETKTTVTDAGGNYSFSAVGDFDYTVRPSKTLYNFYPAAREYRPLFGDLPYQDFKGSPLPLNLTPGP